MEPKVGIVISAYNQIDLLKICIDSVFKKTNYKNYFIVLVDDSGKGEIGPGIKKKFGRRVDVLINKKNKGFSGAYNVGLKKAMQKMKKKIYNSKAMTKTSGSSNMTTTTAVASTASTRRCVSSAR